MAQETAVQWLENQIKSIDIGSGIKMKIDIPKEFLEQAKEMEKKQIKMAYNDGADHMVESKYEGMDNYYKLRYGSNNQI